MNQLDARATHGATRPPLQALVDAVDCVSFDIFDTAILRKVEAPTDVFRLVESDYRHAHPAASDCAFVPARLEAEAEARRLAWMERRAPEVTLNEIYARLQSPNDWSAEELSRLERRIEREVCVQNEFIHAIYAYALATGKRVVFTSDMYLPAETIRAILQDNGYESFAELYLSSAHGQTKSQGHLYRRVLDDARVTPDRVLHIGDNYDSDVLAARRLGLLAHHYRKCSTFSTVTRPAASLSQSIQRGLTNNRFFAHREIRSEDDFWFRLGYESAGVLYLAFARWLAEEVSRSGVEHVYFLSRDGWIMKQVYDRLASGPPSSYLYASRRALNVPALTQIDDHALDFLVSGTSVLRVADFLGRLGLRAEDYRAPIARAGFGDSSQSVVSGEDYGRLRALYRLIEPDLLRAAAEERAVALEYFAQLGVTGTRRIAVVDLGWHGSLQSSLATLLRLANSQVEISGYYLGTFAAARRYAERGLELHGFLCEEGQPSLFDTLIRTCVEIFEFLHVAPHGSVVRFQKTPLGVEPVLAGHDAEPAALEKARELQAGALAFVDEFLPLLRDRPWLAIEPEQATAPLARVLLAPSMEEATRLGELTHAEGFGDVFVKRPIARPPAAWRIARSPRQLLIGLNDAFWKEGYKTRVFGRNRVARWLGEIALRRLARP